MNTFFLDLDGVMCDFLGGFKKKFKVNFFDIPEEEAWGLVKDQPNLWAELEPCNKALLFWSMIKEYNPIILTAVPKTSFITSAQNKRHWVREWLGDNVRMIPVQGGTNKAAYINHPGDILIDDMEKNIKPWIKHGGFGIIHNGDWWDTYTKFMNALEKQ